MINDSRRHHPSAPWLDVCHCCRGYQVAHHHHRHPCVFEDALPFLCRRRLPTDLV